MKIDFKFKDINLKDFNFKDFKFIEKLTSVVLALAVGFSLLVAFQVLTKGYVTIGGFSTFRVVTGSMEPTIKTGALLVCKSTDIKDIKVNDIICFQSKALAIKNEVVTHRVIEIKDIDGNLRLTTRGDANSVDDALYVTSNNLIGKVSWYSKDGNIIAAVISFMSGQIGFLAFIVIPVLVVCGFSLNHSMRNIQLEIAELRRLELQKESKKIEPVLETDEELRVRLRAEIRKELGLDDE